MARPLKDISASQVYKLARIGCTTPEIATICDVDERTIERRFAATLKKGREKMKMSLRRMQYRVAQTGDRTMLIWLGKQYLQQQDAPPPINPRILEKLDAQQLRRIMAGEDPQIVTSTTSSSSTGVEETSEHVN